MSFAKASCHLSCSLLKNKSVTLKISEIHLEGLGDNKECPWQYLPGSCDILVPNFSDTTLLPKYPSMHHNYCLMSFRMCRAQNSWMEFLPRYLSIGIPRMPKAQVEFCPMTARHGRIKLGNGERIQGKQMREQNSLLEEAFKLTTSPQTQDCHGENYPEHLRTTVFGNTV